MTLSPGLEQSLLRVFIPPPLSAVSEPDEMCKAISSFTYHWVVSRRCYDFANLPDSSSHVHVTLCLLSSRRIHRCRNNIDWEVSQLSKKVITIFLLCSSRVPGTLQPSRKKRSNKKKMESIARCPWRWIQFSLF